MDVQMGWIAWIAVGVVAGWLASHLARGRLGMLGEMLVGATGAFIAGYAYDQMSAPGPTDFKVWSLFFAAIGAAFLLVVIHRTNRPRGVFAH